jgi:hypothetical protein
MSPDPQGLARVQSLDCSIFFHYPKRLVSTRDAWPPWDVITSRHDLFDTYAKL